MKSDMKDFKKLLFTCLLITGVCGEKDTVFVYSRLGGVAVLPCTNVLSGDCSSVSWTFFRGGQVRYTEEVTAGRVSTESDRHRRMALNPNCSISLKDLKVDDAGSYVCLENGSGITDVYLSLLTVTSWSPVTELRPGGKLSLSCVLFTYYDAGSCKSYNSVFNLSWADGEGNALPENRFEPIGRTRCNITLVTTLQPDDHNRKWSCQVTTRENTSVTSVDFTSTFVMNNPQFTHNPSVTAADCEVELPVSRIMLCVALPVMVMVVGFFTWKGDRKKNKMSSAGIEMS